MITTIGTPIGCLPPHPLVIVEKPPSSRNATALGETLSYMFGAGFGGMENPAWISGLYLNLTVVIPVKEMINTASLCAMKPSNDIESSAVTFPTAPPGVAESYYRSNDFGASLSCCAIPNCDNEEGQLRHSAN